MKSFTIALANPALHQHFLVEAFHTADLSGRTGYSSKFLKQELPLPALSERLKQDCAKVKKDIGSNGDHILDYNHFSVSFNKAKKLPFFTAVNIDGTTDLMGMEHEQRGSDKWFTDDRIKEGATNYQFNDEDYLSSGFDKGHMVRFYDPAWGKTTDEKKTAMGDTFHYTNCCPQIHHFNGVVWNYLEDYYMARAIFQDKKVSVFTGPVFNKAKQVGRLLVPLNFWKVVVYTRKDGTLGALGFVMSHEKYLNKIITESFLIAKKTAMPKLTKEDIDELYKKQEIVDAKVKISFIEEKTGLSFGLNSADDNKGKDQYFYELLQATSPQFKDLVFESLHPTEDLTDLFKQM